MPLPDPLKYCASLSIGEAIFEVAATEKGISKIKLPSLESAPVSRTHPMVHLNINWEPGGRPWAWLHELEMFMRSYFAGKDPGAGPPVDMSGLSPFRRKVLEAVCLIEWGETRSYGWVAEKAGNREAARASGNALGRNPVPILVPCHRVLRGDGSIGGFSAGTGWKMWLLDFESGIGGKR